MAETPHSNLWLELRKRGLIGSAQPLRLGGGNLDRADRSRTVYRVDFTDGSPGKVTLGAGLYDLRNQLRSFANTFPALAKVPLFEVRIDGTDMVGERFFEGITFREAVTKHVYSTAFLHHAFFHLIDVLQSEDAPSTDTARQAEWDAWCRGLVALPIWSPAEACYLQDTLLPALAARLLVGPPKIQWVHGDLTDENLLINSSGEIRVIDLEFAERTHFFPTEAARFHALSSSANRQPALFTDVLPCPDPGWQLHFWLTQIQREVAINSAEYVEQWLPSRLSVVQGLISCLFGPELVVPWNAPLHETPAPTETIQLFWDTTRIAAPTWTEADSERLIYHQGSIQHIFLATRDRPPPWRIDPSSSSAITVIHRLAVYSKEHLLIRSFVGVQMNELSLTALGDTSIQISAQGAAIQAPSGDPQLVFDLPHQLGTPEIHWIELELCTARARSGGISASLGAYRIEETRWLDLAPAIFRIGGWYHLAEYGQVSRFLATISGAVVASGEPIRRVDVHRHFSGASTALLTGFQLDLPRTVTGETIGLIAEYENGGERFFHSLTVSAPPKRAILADNYARWAEQHDGDPPAPHDAAYSTLKFSILLPVYNTNLAHLEQCLGSVRGQYHQNWELCIVDDGSIAEVGRVLAAAGRADDRIKISRRPKNGGIARTTNDALAMATGEYVVFLDHDDLMRPHALTEFAAKLASEPQLDAVYSDEDKIDAHGIRMAPLLKPDHSPIFLCGVMFIGHLLCVRTALARSVGGFDPAYDGIQDYEFFLRLTEKSRHIGHLPRMLYHWRMSPASSALTGNIKGDMDALQLRAVRAHLERTARPFNAVALGGHRVRLQPAGPLRSKECTVLFANVRHSNILNCSAPVTVATSPDVNGVMAAVALATTPFVLIATCALKPEEPDWLEHLLAFAAESDSGAVGPVLLKNEVLVASAGTLLSPEGEVVPLMAGFARDGEGYNGSLLCTREVLALSAGCFAIRRETLLAAAKLNRFGDFNDWMTDLCLTLHAGGKRNLICGSAHLTRVEAGAEDVSLSPALNSDLRDKWRGAFESDDPFYPALCDRRSGDYQLRSDISLTAEHSSTLRFYIDVPTSFQLPGGYLRMRGWCWSPKAKLLQVRLLLPDFEVFGRYGTFRPDVQKTYPDIAEVDIGFELWANVPTGDHTASLEFQDEAGTWVQATKIALSSSRAVLPLWLPGRPINDLVHFQLGARPSHAPRKIVPERFPAPRTSLGSRPRFTIVTPSYNQRRYLSETLGSVLDQSGVEISYIVQDGGSTDGSVQLLEEHSARLARWESIRDNGQADAIARGFASSPAGKPEDLMAWINSDDVYLPGALGYVADYFAQHPDVDAIYGHRILIDDNSKEVGRWFLPAHEDEMLRLNDYIPQETLFWRRRLWDNVGGINPAFKFAMDWDLLLRFSSAGARIIRVPYFLACFRIHAVQKTSAQIDGIGGEEISQLRTAAQGRALSPIEVETDPRLIRYLRKSAWIEFLWRTFGVRHP